MKPEKLVIIGNGVATMRLLQALEGQQQFQVTVLSADNIAHYNRVMLSPLLAGETTLADISFDDPAWYQRESVDIRLGHKVDRIDTDNKTVSCENGFSCSYDRLIIASGAYSTGPQIPGLEHHNVRYFRDVEDVTAMRNVALKNQRCVVIGAGLLGVEAASGLAKQGAKVSLVHRSNTIMNRQIDGRAAQLLSTALMNRGICLYTGAEFSPKHISGTDSATGVILENGEELPADLVIFATGIRPNTDLAKEAGVLTERGICVNEYMETSIEHVYALGESCEFNGNTYGLVAPILQQAKILAKRLLGDAIAYEDANFTTKLKVSGMDVHSMGEFSDDVITKISNDPTANTSANSKQAEAITYEDPSNSVYRKIVLQNNRIIGAVLYGDVSDSQWYFDLMNSNTDITELRSGLALGSAFCIDNSRAA